MQRRGRDLEKIRVKVLNSKANLEGEKNYVIRLTETMERQRVFLARLLRQIPEREKTLCKLREKYETDMATFRNALKKKPRSVDAIVDFNACDFVTSGFNSGETMKFHLDASPVCNNVESRSFPYRRGYSPYRYVSATPHLGYLAIKPIKLAFFRKAFRECFRSNCDSVVDIIEAYAPFAQVKIAAASSDNHFDFFPVAVQYFFDLGPHLPPAITILSDNGPHYIKAVMDKKADGDRCGGNHIYVPRLSCAERINMRKWFTSAHVPLKFRIVFQFLRKTMQKRPVAVGSSDRDGWVSRLPSH